MADDAEVLVVILAGGAEDLVRVRGHAAIIAHDMRYRNPQIETGSKVSTTSTNCTSSNQIVPVFA